MNARKSVISLPRIGAELNAFVLGRCAAAKAYENVYEFEKARECLEVFIGAGESILNDLSDEARAEALLRVGSLQRNLPGLFKVEEYQEKAKTSLCEALDIFHRLGNEDKTAETLITLAYCHWSSGTYKQSRQLLEEPVFDRPISALNKANRLYVLALNERAEKRHAEAITLFEQALDCGVESLAHTCKYNGALGSEYLLLGERDGDARHVNLALYHFTIASQEAEDAGNTKYAGFLYNNVAFAFYRHGRLEEALEHAKRARGIFERQQNFVYVASVDETCARVLIAQKKFREAEALLRRSIQTFEGRGESAKQAEALLTLSEALKGMGRTSEARAAAARASEIYALNEDADGEGQAQLALAELLAEGEPPNLERLLKSFVRSVRLLAPQADARISERLDRIEEKISKLTRREPSCRLSHPDETAAATPDFLWDEGLSLDEAQAQVEEWYLSRLLIENGTLTAIARALGLSVEGASKKLSKYPHLRLLYEAMREGKVTPLARGSALSSSGTFKIRLDGADDYLAMVGPQGGDTLEVQKAESLLPNELGVIEIDGERAVGYLGAADGRPKLYSGHRDYPPAPLAAGKFKVVGKVIGYWKGQDIKGKSFPLLKR